MDIARYRATLQALTEARQTVARVLCSGRLDDAQREEWHWMLDLLDSVEWTARRSLRDDILVGSAARASRR